MPYRRTSKQISSNRKSCRFQGEGEQKMPHWRIWKQIWTLKGGMLVCRGSHNKAPTTENSSKIDFLTALEARSPRARSWHVWILWSPLSYSLASYSLQYSWASLVAQLVKNSPAMWETWFQSLDWEDPLEKGKATTPVFWPGEFHDLYSPWRHKESDTPERLSLSHPLPIGCFWLSYQLLADSTCRGFYLGSPFYSINMCFYFYASAKLFWLL